MLTKKLLFIGVPLEGRSGERERGAGARSVDRVLLRNGEQPGFRPDGDALTVVGVNAIANHWRLAPAAAQQLGDRGFISFTTRRTLGRDGAAGVHEVLLFRTRGPGTRWRTTTNITTGTKAQGPSLFEPEPA